MPLDPQAEQLIEWSAAENLPATHRLPPEEARRMFRLRCAKFDSPPVSVAHNEDRRIPGPGGELVIRVYTPWGRSPFPALVYFHGGGWVIGDLDTHQSSCCYLAHATPCVVIAVDYRLAPENKFPAAAEDCYAAARWVTDNARTINVAAGRVAVGGDSSGGNLAAAVSLMARDRGEPALIFQLLIYPVFDFRFDTQSYNEYRAGYFLTKEMCVYFWEQYLRSESDGNNPNAAPIRAENLAGLPPAFVLTAQYDPLRDEGQAYARRLKEAGVPVISRNYEGLIHGFWGMGAVLDRTRRVRQEVSEVLHSVFAEKAAGTA